MPNVVVIGSLNMDLVTNVEKLPEKAETVAANFFQKNPGGKGANQALAIAKLGVDVTMVGCVGNDAYGKELLDNLMAFNVNVLSVLVKAEKPTGIALITVDRQGDNTIVVFPGANGTCRIDEINFDVFTRMDCLLVQLEIPIITVQKCLENAKNRGLFTVLNPAPVYSLSKEILKNVDLLIPNEIEAADLTNKLIIDPSTAIEAGKILVDRGATRVVITLGVQGAVFVGPEGTYYQPAFEINEVDSTAAGDTFIAAFTVKWLSGVGVERSLEYACAAGAIAASRNGAQAAIPTPTEIEFFLKRISI